MTETERELDLKLGEAMAEIRQLAAANAELVTALEVVLRDYKAVYDIGDIEMQPAIYHARAAITKHQGAKS